MLCLAAGDASCGRRLVISTQGCARRARWEPARRPGLQLRSVSQDQRRSVVSRVAEVLEPPPAAPEEGQRRSTEADKLQDPWTDPKWTKYTWTVYRGVAYDMGPFMEKHPGGRWLLNLAIGRDCTALFESNHLRPKVAVSHLKRLPVIKDFPVESVPQSPYPNDSDFYNTVRERVRKEVFKGADVKGAHRSGSEAAAVAVVGFGLLTSWLYLSNPGLLTGMLAGIGGAWVGLTIQHCGNHGAMSTKAWINGLMGLTNDITGGSSLMWRYHHQVSHHIHCNDEALDEDVFNAMPFLRFDSRLPHAWYHRWQHIYMWATFPLLTVVFQIGDWQALLTGRTKGATLYGASAWEKTTMVLGKLAYYTFLVGIPMLTHGGQAAALGAAGYFSSQGILLASTFAVSHNLAETKPSEEGNLATDNLLQDMQDRDWGLQQLYTSASWGGVVGNFFTGGLNLQIEHHLFPAISFVHYPAIQAIVRDECRRRGIPYQEYGTLPEILARFVNYMKAMGREEQMEGKEMLERQFLISRV